MLDWGKMFSFYSLEIAKLKKVDMKKSPPVHSPGLSLSLLNCIHGRQSILDPLLVLQMEIKRGI